MKTFVEILCFMIGLAYLTGLISVALIHGWDGVKLIPKWSTAVGAAAMIALFWI